MCRPLTSGFYISSGEGGNKVSLENKLNQTEVVPVDKVRFPQHTCLIRVFPPPFFSRKEFERKKTLMGGFTAELYRVLVEHFHSELLGIGSYRTPQALVMSP